MSEYTGKASLAVEKFGCKELRARKCMLFEVMGERFKAFMETNRVDLHKLNASYRIHSENSAGFHRKYLVRNFRS